MITERKDGLIDHTKLEGQEIQIFKKFLEMERARHQEDIDKIDNTLSEMKHRKSDVIIYTTPNCIWCDKLKDFLKENKIKYQEFDVASDNKKAEEMVNKSGQMGVPVTDIKGKITVGFDQDRIKQHIDLLTESEIKED